MQYRLRILTYGWQRSVSVPGFVFFLFCFAIETLYIYRPYLRWIIDTLFEHIPIAVQLLVHRKLIGGNWSYCPRAKKQRRITVCWAHQQFFLSQLPTPWINLWLKILFLLLYGWEWFVFVVQETIERPTGNKLRSSLTNLQTDCLHIQTYQKPGNFFNRVRVCLCVASCKFRKAKSTI